MRELNLVLQNGESVISHTDLAKSIGLQPQSLLNTIDKHLNKLENIGTIFFFLRNG